MDTKPLERFATQARRDLLAAVDARATAVLAAGSVARVERPDVVRKLEAEITAHGRAHVVDKVAYTWFNRIIALRFMDARGYTDAGIVSPAQGQTLGQPEILADAKRGHLDADVVINTNMAATILSLLDGTRRSTDAEGEAYALLLTEYCRYWHKSMPFMFEREGDYTELLVPAGLLADGAILSMAREVMTEQVCDDVEVIGWLYQFYISEKKDEVFANFKDNKKAGPDEIPAATQLFTPHWIVRFLVENSLGRLWMLNRPTSRLVDRMEYFIAPVDHQTDFLKVASAEELTVIDPACGSGHLLTYSFDLLYAIYEEEGYSPSEIPGLILKYNLHGTDIDPRAGALAAFALTMKARARQRTIFDAQIEPKICVLEPIWFGPEELELLEKVTERRGSKDDFWNQFAEADTAGSLIQPDGHQSGRASQDLALVDPGDDIFRADTLDRALRVVQQAQFLSAQYAIAVANPPYMGSKNMGTALSDFVKLKFAQSKADLFACFISRCRQLVLPGGFVGMITMQSWMFLQSFEALRDEIVRNNEVSTLAHLGSGAFDSIGGDVVSTAAFVLSAGHAGRTTFLRLTSEPDESAKAKSLRSLRTPGVLGRHDLDLATLGNLPGKPLSYWLEPHLVVAFETADTVQQIAPVCQGLATADSARFVRGWVEVSASNLGIGLRSREDAKATGRRWFPENKGGPSRRWYGNQWHVLDWKDDGAELFALRPKSVIRNPQHYFKPSVSWSAVGASKAFRYYPAGFIFDNAGMSIIPPDDDTAMYLLGCLNSSISSEIASALAPTMNLNAGTVAELPIPRGSRLRISDSAREAVAIARSDWVDAETSWEFKSIPLLAEELDGKPLAERARSVQEDRRIRAERLLEIESYVDGLVADGFGVSGIHESNRTPSSGLSRPSLLDLVTDLVSYAVGCMFGRYSIDEPGLILADQGATLNQYLEKVRAPTIRPDIDNVIPLVDDGWFEDDIVDRFRQFLRGALGGQHFEENLRFVEESIGGSLRDYFISPSGKSRFYEDHLQRYKKRPIYWMFSSPKGSFNALIYMHRYNPSTVSTVLNEYLREYRAKLEVALANADQAAAAESSKGQKEADRLRKVLAELSDYEHDVLYPLATQQIAIDLDDGVKANYPKFYPALRKIAGLEAAE